MANVEAVLPSQMHPAYTTTDSPQQSSWRVPICETLLKIEIDQAAKLQVLPYSEPVEYVYNPMEYAFETHSQFVRQYCTTTKKILFIGMNPGPFGMGQTGVPFGEVNYVKNWLKITGNVGKPRREHPRRQIDGLQCKRNEVSGQRFWGFFEELCKTPENFFSKAYVHNYCPLMFMTENGKNVTPPELALAERKLLQNICDEALCQVVTLLQVKVIIAIGRFTQKQAQGALAAHGLAHIPVGFLMHPSPINPAANRGWKDIATKQLLEHNILHELTANNTTEP